MQHQLVRDALFVEQGEVRALPHDVGGVREQVLARAYGTGQEPVRGSGTRLGGQDAAQEVQELAAALAGEQPAVLGGRHREQVAHAVVAGVVQVRRAADEARRLRGDPEKVGEILAVPADLDAGVQPRPGDVLHRHQR